MSLPVEEMAFVGATIGGCDLTPPKDPLTVTPAPHAMTKLRRLHAAAVQLAEDAPEIIAHPEAARGLEQALIEALVDCFAEGAVDEDQSAQRRHSLIMRRFRRAVEENSDRSLYIPERLVASFALAARANGLSDADGHDAAVACARSYHRKMRDFAAMDVLDVWYARLDDSDFLAMLPKSQKAVLSKRIAKAAARGSSELVFPKLVEQAGAQARIHDTPPTISHAEASRAAGDMDMLREGLAKYRETLAEDRRVLFDRYRLVDAAVKVVGIGSVGTLCMVALMMSVADNPLFLQFKQANASVLEAYAGESVYAQHGERVVQGQRLMQPSSDLFLGWVIGPEGRHFYIRQLRDVKLSPLVETYDAEMLSIYGEACGWVLARAHAKAGDPWAISGYLGKNAQFDEAMGKFALAYADQAERDHAALKAAVRAGIVEVQLEH
jgi:hypothetical protein